MTITLTATSTGPSGSETSVGKLKLNGHANGSGSTSYKASNGHGEYQNAINGKAGQDEAVLVDPYNYVVSIG
jgi:hypothetical protein